jgi:uncharacterized protein
MIKKKIQCLNCKTQFIYGESPFRPFCSERCKMIDLGHWLNETYTIPLGPVIEGEDLDEFEDESESEYR